MDEFMEVKIGDKVFQIKKDRSFKAQCDLDMHLDSKGNTQRYWIIIADCKIEDLDKGPHGNVVGKKYRDVTMEDISAMNAEEGDKLYLELLKFRFGDILKKKQKIKSKKKK